MQVQGLSCNKNRSIIDIYEDFYWVGITLKLRKRVIKNPNY